MNPFDLPGPEFLLFYLIFAVVVVVTLGVVRRRGEDGPVPRFSSIDPYLIAHLRAGVPETIRVAVVSLIDRGLLHAEGTILSVTRRAAVTSVARPIEKALLQACAHPVEASTLFDNAPVKEAAVLLSVELSRQRLLPDDQQEHRRFLLGALGTVMLLGVSGIKIALAISRGRSNFLFLIFFAVVAILVLFGFAISPHRTRLGDRVLRDLQELFSGLRARAVDLPLGGATNEVALLVGIFGLGALAGESHTRATALFPRAPERHLVLLWQQQQLRLFLRWGRWGWGLRRLRGR